MNKEKTAKEMFEELGYELVNKSPLLYQFDDGGYIRDVEFINTHKEIRLSEWENYSDYRFQEEYCIKIQLLQAINKQVEELGWKNTTSKQVEVYIDTEDLEERCSEEKYKRYLEEELKFKNSIIEEVIQLLKYYYIGNLKYDKESQNAFKKLLKLLNKYKGDSNEQGTFRYEKTD